MKESGRLFAALDLAGEAVRAAPRHLRGLASFLMLLAFCTVAPSAFAAARSFAYDLSGRLWRAMDADGTLLTYGYDAVGNITKISRDKVDPNFNILGVLPLTGGAGDLVTIQGNGFDANLIGNQVQIGGVDATVVSVDPNGRKLTVKVPWGAESGPVNVSVGGNSASAPDPFTIVHYGDLGIHGSLGAGGTTSYPVELRAGQSIQIRLADPAHGSFYPNLVLNDPSEKQVSTGSGTEVAAVSYTATTAGTFQIVVSDRQNVGGDYVLYYAVAPGSNEGGTLDPNDPIDGVLDQGDLDSFTFEVDAGQGVRLSVSDVGLGNLYPYVVVYDPSGAVVGQAGGYNVAAYGFSAAVSGRYTAVVFDASGGNAATGSYRLFFAAGKASNEGGALDPNAPLDGAIDQGDLDSYTFDATAGQPVRVSVADVGATSLYPYLFVYDPSGAQIGYAGGYDVAEYAFTPSASGKYTVVVLDASSGNAATGSYKIYYARAPGSNDGGALDQNNPIDGKIDEGDIDAFTFDVTAGGSVRVSVADVGATSLYPYLFVYDPSGGLVQQAGGYNVAEAAFAPNVSGKYTVFVLDASSGNAATGAYKIYFAQLPGSNDGGALDPNSPVDGTIDEGDLDTFTFDATAGQPVRISVTDVAATSLYPYLFVYDANGDQVTEVGGYNVAQAAFTPTTSGKYSVLVLDASSGNAATGDYKIYLAQLPGSNDSGALDANNPVSGTIDEGDLDTYTFSATAGQPVRLSMVDVDATSLYPYLMVYDSSGALVSQAGGYNVAEVAFTPTKTGTYTALVFDASSGSAATGAYKVYLAQLPGSTDGGALDANLPVDGTIDEGDLDTYTFDATAGQTVRISVTDVAATALYPYVIVYDPSGGLVQQAGGYNVAEVAFKAGFTGKYSVLVFDASSGSASTGAYQVYLAQAPGSNDGGALDPNLPVDGTIDEGDLDAYTMTLNAGQTVQLRVADLGATSLYPYFQVYDPSGALVVQAGGYDVAGASFTASVAGKYTLVAFDASSGSAATGAYKVYSAEAPGSNEGGALTVSTAVSGTIDLGDIDSYTFTAAAGNKFQLVATDVNAGAFVPYLVVYDATGKSVAANSGATTATASFTAATAGTYTAFVLDASNGSAATGAYSLILNQN